jgi:hypothetical protein
MHHVWKLLSLNHTPGLFVVTAPTFGGMWPTFKPESATCDVGFRKRIYDSEEAQFIMILGIGRTTVISIALYTF